MVTKRLGLVLGGILLALVFGEILFRIVPFERFKYEVRYGHFSGNTVSRFLEYDPVLTFRNRRGAAYPDARVAINSLGLRGPEALRKKPAGLTRVLCLGDSCTFGGAHPYPEILQSLLDRKYGKGRFEVLNGGVIGYTSLHGLEWFRRELESLQPDIVTIYFGWNDMWREKDAAIREWFRRRLRADQSRARSYLWEAVTRSTSFVNNRLAFSADVPIQIPPERYHEILQEFARLGERDGFKPIYVTAPSGFDGERAPSWLVEKGFVAPGDSALRLREIYNQVVIDVASERSAPVADCAAAFSAAGGRALFERPEEDPIHPNDKGYRMIAETLARTIEKLSP